MGGVRKMSIFAGIPYYVFMPTKSEWVRKSPKMCLHIIGMVPFLQLHAVSECIAILTEPSRHVSEFASFYIVTQ